MQIILRYFPDLTKEQQERFAALDSLYREWNARINVISRKDIDALYEHHVLHSLGIAKAYPLTVGMRVMDLGTGGGFPGIPLAILYPDVHFHLVDSIAKKIRVCNEIVRALGLTNVTTQWTRVEQIHERFDCIVSRAVAPLDTLVRWSRPLSGHLVCLKGIDEVESSKSIDIKPLSQWFSEEFFATKAVIHKRLIS
ncbi:MAG: 16S rRNA (guanine(527)-N(7))-methyltransferase RsmG [Bacteroidaceae bacterium]|nr:16S rRNA (guanine(527)-N(7))-methyltransferase RsmG [Bacteroidaceae bacterium]